LIIKVLKQYIRHRLYIYLSHLIMDQAKYDNYNDNDDVCRKIDAAKKYLPAIICIVSLIMLSTLFLIIDISSERIIIISPILLCIVLDTSLHIFDIIVNCLYS